MFTFFSLPSLIDLSIVTSSSSVPCKRLIQLVVFYQSITSIASNASTMSNSHVRFSAKCSESCKIICRCIGSVALPRQSCSSRYPSDLRRQRRITIAIEMLDGTTAPPIDSTAPYLMHWISRGKLFGTMREKYNQDMTFSGLANITRR